MNDDTTIIKSGLSRNNFLISLPFCVEKKNIFNPCRSPIATGLLKTMTTEGQLSKLLIIQIFQPIQGFSLLQPSEIPS